MQLERSLEIRDGHLFMDGFDVVELASQLETPFFLYSGRQLRWNIEGLRNAFTRRHLDTELFFASKACSNLWFLDQVRRSGINVEVNSGGELWKALKVGFKPEQIVFNGVAKTRHEIGQAIDHDIRAIVVDSLYELERITDVARDYLKPAKVSLRIDVEIETLTHPEIRTSHGAKAGIDIDDALDAFGLAAAHEYIDLKGVHMHIGSQITGVEPYVLAMETALDVVEYAERSFEMHLEHIDAGGGFAIPYRNEPVCDPEDYLCSRRTPDDYAEAICGVLERRRPDLRLFLEPGRSIAASTAVLVTRIENEKTKGVRDVDGHRVGTDHWLTIDAGFNVLLDHVSVDWYFPALVANRAGEEAATQFRLAGPLCDGGDVVPGEPGTPYRVLPAGTTVGDLVALLNVGAYTLETMFPYNARPRAAAYAVADDAVIQIRQEDSLVDLIASDYRVASGEDVDSGPPARTGGKGSKRRVRRGGG
jgi:diaminopimelate decarboxylase